ncbi:MAG: hypothetical protein ACJ796_21435 [Gemmatimonadaceae bacterium]
MRRLLLLGSLVVSAVGAANLSAQAQQPAPGPGGTGGPGFGVPGVEMLLSQTGALQLSDAQVVRLAAIARRSADRRRALMTRLDSLRPRRLPGDSATRRERPMPATDLFTHERDAAHNDLRDALGVLTADQQARAWEMIAARRTMPFGRGGMMRQRSPADGAGRDGGNRDGAARGRSGGAAPGQRRPDQGT